MVPQVSPDPHLQDAVDLPEDLASLRAQRS
jgi:hypothetical protein